MFPVPPSDTRLYFKSMDPLTQETLHMKNPRSPLIAVGLTLFSPTADIFFLLLLLLLQKY